MPTPALQSTAPEHDDARQLVGGRAGDGGLIEHLRVVNTLLLRGNALTHQQRESLERYRDALRADIAAVRHAVQLERDAALLRLLNGDGRGLGGLDL